MARYEPGIDVVMTNYRTPEDAASFLFAFADLQYEVPCSLTVVNVDPTAQDVEVVERLLCNITVPTTYLMYTSNVGYARACNGAASALADGEPRQTLAFFNADTILRPGVLDTCHWELHSKKDYGVCGPRQIDDYGRITHAGIMGTEEHPSLRGWQMPDQGQFNEVDWDCVSVSGSAYFVKRHVWDELTDCLVFRDNCVASQPLGAFLPTQHYYEETWCSYHARAHGYRVGYVGNVQMIHRWHQASPIGGIGEQKMAESQAMFRSMCDKHGILHD